MSEPSVRENLMKGQAELQNELSSLKRVVTQLSNAVNDVNKTNEKKLIKKKWQLLINLRKIGRSFFSGDAPLGNKSGYFVARLVHLISTQVVCGYLVAYSINENLNSPFDIRVLTFFSVIAAVVGIVNIVANLTEVSQPLRIDPLLNLLWMITSPEHHLKKWQPGGTFDFFFGSYSLSIITSFVLPFLIWGGVSYTSSYLQLTQYFSLPINSKLAFLLKLAIDIYLAVCIFTGMAIVARAIKSIVRYKPTCVDDGFFDEDNQSEAQFLESNIREIVRTEVAQLTAPSSEGEIRGGAEEEPPRNGVTRRKLAAVTPTLSAELLESEKFVRTNAVLTGQNEDGDDPWQLPLLPPLRSDSHTPLPPLQLLWFTPSADSLFTGCSSHRLNFREFCTKRCVAVEEEIGPGLHCSARCASRGGGTNVILLLSAVGIFVLSFFYVWRVFARRKWDSAKAGLLLSGGR